MTALRDRLPRTRCDSFSRLDGTPLRPLARRARATRLLALVLVLAGCRTSADPAHADPAQSSEHSARPRPAQDGGGAAESAASPGAAAADEASAATANPLADWDAELGLRGTSNGGAWRIKYRTLPDPIPLNEEFGLEVAVFDAAGEHVSEGIALAADAGMPQHRHGMLRQASVAPREDGTFLVDGMLFHMPGAWELYFDVTRGAVTERTQFDVELD